MRLHFSYPVPSSTPSVLCPLSNVRQFPWNRSSVPPPSYPLRTFSNTTNPFVYLVRRRTVIRSDDVAFSSLKTKWKTTDNWLDQQQQKEHWKSIEELKVHRLLVRSSLSVLNPLGSCWLVTTTTMSCDMKILRARQNFLGHSIPTEWYQVEDGSWQERRGAAACSFVSSSTDRAPPAQSVFCYNILVVAIGP